MKRSRYYGPSPTVAEPRRPLRSRCPLLRERNSRLPWRSPCRPLGFADYDQGNSKSVDVLVTIDGALASVSLGRRGRRLQGFAQAKTLGADISWPMIADAILVASAIIHSAFRARHVDAQNCGRREHLNDDLQLVTPADQLIAAPPITLWPNVVRRGTVPADVEKLLLTELERVG